MVMPVESLEGRTSSRLRTSLASRVLPSNRGARSTTTVEVEISGRTRAAQEVRKRLDVRPSKDSTGITIDAKAADAASARALANAVGTAYQQVSRDRTI